MSWQAVLVEHTGEARFGRVTRFERLTLDPAVAYDIGLRAHMIRVYNNMAWPAGLPDGRGDQCGRIDYRIDAVRGRPCSTAR